MHISCRVGLYHRNFDLFEAVLEKKGRLHQRDAFVFQGLDQGKGRRYRAYTTLATRSLLTPHHMKHARLDHRRIIHIKGIDDILILSSFSSRQ